MNNTPLADARQLLDGMARRLESREIDPVTEINECYRILSYVLAWAESIQVVALIDLSGETEH